MRNIVPAQQLLSSEINILSWVCLKWNFLRISDVANSKDLCLEHQTQISQRTQNWKPRVLLFQETFIANGRKTQMIFLIYCVGLPLRLS